MWKIEAGAASCLLGKKNLAGSHEVHEVAQAVAILGKGGSKPIDFTAVDGFKASADGVGEHFLSETTCHKQFSFHEHFFEFNDVSNLIPVGHSD